MLEHAPEALRAALATAPTQLRHRVRIQGPEGAASRRVPALPLNGPALIALVDAIGALLEARFGEQLLDRLAEALAAGAAVALEDTAPAGCVAMPDLLTATVLDLEARRAVERRALRVVAAESFGRPVLCWQAAQADRPPLLHHLVDARARAAFARHLHEQPAAEDPLGVLPALASEAELQADLPQQRRITRAFDAYLVSGRSGVQLASTDSALVVRLFEPAPGAERATWPLQTCLREPDGTVHPVADLRAVGDLTAAGAAEASAAILRLAPTVRRAAVDETGVDWLLTTTEVSVFLTKDTAALEDAGVTVLLPREWTKQRTTLRPQEVEEADPAAKAGASVGLGSVASFTWRVAVGETELTEQEIAEIMSAQGEIVKLRGQWVRLDADTLRAAERFLEVFTGRARPLPPRILTKPAAEPSASPTAPAEISGDTTWTDLFALLLSPDAAQVDLGAWAITAGGRNGLSRLLPGGGGPYPHPQPASLEATLRPYQVDGLNWMWALERLGLGGILADDMGLGKTMQVLALLCRQREGTDAVPPRQGPTLLVCPMSVVGAWQREAARFAPHLAVHVHHGGDRVRDESFIAGAADLDLVITTYSLLARDLPVLSAVAWHRIVYDEAQHLKNPGTQVSRAARSLSAPHRFALTGTPVENRLTDLHSLMQVVNPGLLGTATQFMENVATPIEEDGDAGAISRLKFVTSAFVLRRVKTDRSIISDLPQKTELTRIVNLTPEQAGLYESLVEELLEEIDQVEPRQRRSAVVSTLTRLKQVCNHPAHYLGDGSPLLRDGQHRSGKLELADDLLETAFADGEKVLAFTQFTTFGHLLAPYWSEKFALPVPFLHGGVTKRDRDEMVSQFQARPDEPGIMLLSLRAGGTGLTLTAANHVVHLDRWWNPAVENQATDRAYRIGQRRDVSVHKLVSAGTVEERIDTVLADKQALSDLTIAPGEDWIADLDSAALRSLLSFDEGDG